MKKLFAALLVLSSVSAFAATDAQIVSAVFSNADFMKKIGEASITEIEINKVDEKSYELVVNPRAPMVDGCSYSAQIAERMVRYPTGPSSSGIRSILTVTKAKRNCPRFR